jgi:TPP-dependent pyruvate/acetoin dehydrogenase alpha subunit
MDVVAVEAAAAKAAAHIRSGGGPFFLECRTYRFRAHSMFDAQLYREKAEVEEWKQRGPLVRFIEWMEAADMLKPEEREAMETEIAAEIAEAVAYAEEGGWEPVEHLARHVYAEAAP